LLLYRKCVNTPCTYMYVKAKNWPFSDINLKWLYGFLMYSRSKPQFQYDMIFCSTGT
jgi:hypothetical protein